jgi:hypothetical protein
MARLQLHGRTYNLQRKHKHIYIYICIEWHSNPQPRCSKNVETVRAVKGEATAVVGLYLLVACMLITTNVDKGNLDLRQKCSLFMLHCKNS